MAKIKDFDCIAFKRVAQEKIYKQIKGMSPAEEIAWFRQKVQGGRYAELLQRIAAAAQKPDTLRCAEVMAEYGIKKGCREGGLETNPGGVYLRGIRLREEMTQEELARLTGIPRANISAMEHGRRPIGKETARKLAAALHCDYRRFL